MRHLSVFVGLLAVILTSCTGPRAAPQPEITNTPQPVTRLDPTSRPSPTRTTEGLATAEPESIDGPRLVLGLDPANLGLPDAEAESTPINIGLFLSVRTVPDNPSRLEADVAAAVRDLVGGANAILAQCQMHLNLEAAQVIALPERLLRLPGNQAGSWGGHPPPGTENPELFNYEQNERWWPRLFEIELIPSD